MAVYLDYARHRPKFYLPSSTGSPLGLSPKKLAQTQATLQGRAAPCQSLTSVIFPSLLVIQVPKGLLNHLQATSWLAEVKPIEYLGLSGSCESRPGFPIAR